MSYANHAESASTCSGIEKVKKGYYLPFKCRHGSTQISHLPASIATSPMADCKFIHCVCVLGQLSQLINYNQVTNQGTGTPIRVSQGSWEYQLEDLIWL